MRRGAGEAQERRRRGEARRAGGWGGTWERPRLEPRSANAASRSTRVGNYQILGARYGNTSCFQRSDDIIRLYFDQIDLHSIGTKRSV